MTPAEASAIERANRNPSPAMKAGVTVKPGAPTSKPVPDPVTPVTMPLPWSGTSDTAPYASDPAPAVYYEGESCSGSGGYYDDGYSDDSCSGSGSGSSDDTVYVGGDTYSGDDDDDDDSSSGDDDDDDDDDSSSDVDIEWGDDDDDDDDSIDLAPHRELHPPQLQKPVSKPLTLSRPPQRKQSPVSRLALLGVLIAFPLRRRFRSGA